MGELDFLIPHSGPRPHIARFNISVTPEAMALIGHIAVQWGHLIHNIEFQIKFKRMYPAVPQELRIRKIRHEATQQIKFLREIAGHLYANERPTAVAEFNLVLDNILELKDIRDAVVHGTFSLADNQNSNIVGVFFRGSKRSYSLTTLKQTAEKISLAIGTLMEFDQWVNYENSLASFEKLLQQADQSSEPDNSHAPEPSPA